LPIALPLLLAVASSESTQACHGDGWRSVALADCLSLPDGSLPMGAQTGPGVGNGYLLADPRSWFNAVPMQTIASFWGYVVKPGVRQIGGNLGLLVLCFPAACLSLRLRG
jgi:hypothetical protein